jgi:hypothetical protein
MFTLDASTDLSYLTVIPPLSATNGGNINSAAVSLASFIGKIALKVDSGAGSGIAPTVSGYFQSGPNSNGLGATNINVSQLTLTTTNLAYLINVYQPNTVPTINYNISSFTTNNTNQSQVFGLDTRAAGPFLFFIGSVTGGNGSFPLSISAIGAKRIEPL